MNWDYLQPVKIYFGKGRVQEIKKIAHTCVMPRSFNSTPIALQ